MNYYTQMIAEAVNYIENSIDEKLSLAQLASRAGMSDFHFNRIFKTVSGHTLKQYVLGRKLSRALDRLRQTDRSVLDIALDLGFEYPEVFSRDFKRQFGLSPAEYRKGNCEVRAVPKVSIVEREIGSFRGALALKGQFVYLDAMQLVGVHCIVNATHTDFEKNLRNKSEGFLQSNVGDARFQQKQFYTVVTCSGKDDGEYNFFCGREATPNADAGEFTVLDVPRGWYVDFSYRGDMFQIREAFIDDLYRWIMVKEAKLNANGIGMLDIYSDTYPETHAVRILIPVQQPV
jgi:AraC family transcriptional regulator